MLPPGHLSAQPGLHTRGLGEASCPLPEGGQRPPAGGMRVQVEKEQADSRHPSPGSDVLGGLDLQTAPGTEPDSPVTPSGG